MLSHRDLAAVAPPPCVNQVGIGTYGNLRTTLRDIASSYKICEPPSERESTRKKKTIAPPPTLLLVSKQYEKNEVSLSVNPPPHISHRVLRKGEGFSELGARDVGLLQLAGGVGD